MPIPSHDITYILLKRGFVRTYQSTKAEGYQKNKSQRLLFYVNLEAGRNYSGLIVLPVFEAHRNTLLAIPGVGSFNYYRYSSNFHGFPKRKNNGQNEIEYGLPFGFDSVNSLENFIDTLEKI